MNNFHQAKRARRRLACEPCRRKKSKCPSEHPACSFCIRLGQPCHYAEDTALKYSTSAVVTSSTASLLDEANSQRTEERLRTLETKLAAVVRAVRSQAEKEDNDRDFPATSTQANHSPSGDIGFSFAPSILPSWEIIQSASKLYMQFCDCQPLTLFDGENFLETIKDRSPEVLFAILALALRFSDEPVLRDNISDLTEGYAEAARRIVMHQVTNGPVELSTLQTLCLLSLIDFTNGHKHRATIYCNLAANLAKCAGLTSETTSLIPGYSERRRCFWSIFLIKRLQGEDTNAMDPAADDAYPCYPKTEGFASNEEASLVEDGSNTIIENPTTDLGAMAYAIQLSDVWCKTTQYARRRATPSSIPPWSPKSEYATIVAQQMDYETQMPYIHRFKPAGFPSKSITDLNSNRGYWGPWLFIQFVYHTNLCLLNHPLILALRLRTFKKMMPEIFLQHTSDLIATHASWIVYLIDMVEEKSFKISDPLLGHCAAIVATIFLQESFSEDDKVRKEKQIEFKKCLRFVQRLGDEWPHIARLVDKLQRLQNTVSASYHSSTDPQIPTRGLLIDLALFWEVLEYSSSTELSESAGLLFGPSLYSGRQNPTAEVTSMSALPTPTRLQPATDHNRRSSVSNDGVESHGSFVDSAIGQWTPQPRPSSSANGYGQFIEPLYSNDELAVLADSFFNQRSSYGEKTDEWWNNGNL